MRFLVDAQLPPRLASALIEALLLYPVFWFVTTFHPLGPMQFSPIVWWLCVLASSIFYGLLAVGILAAVRYLHDPNEKLKPMFAWYLKALNEMNQFMREMLTVNEALLTQVRAERTELR
jgi:hypothetical protein